MMDNNKQTPAPQASQKAKDTWCRMAASLKTLPREIIACLLLSLLIACTVFGVGGYAAGRSSAADASIVAEKKKLDGEYKKLVKQTEEKQDEYNSVLDDWKSAVDTIDQANHP